MAYVKHKPQYRNVRTPDAASIGRPRDIRRALPDARGKVILPDSSGLPRAAKFGGTPRVARPFGRAGFSFSPPALSRAPASFWWRGGMAQIAPAMRGMAWAMAAYDIYRSVDQLLGGDPYMAETEVKFGGGPNGNYAVVTHGDVPGKSVLIPAPNGMAGWNFSVHNSYVYSVLTGRNQSWNDEHRRNYPALHRSPGNPLGEYSEGYILSLGLPPGLNPFNEWQIENRLQRGGMWWEVPNWTNLLPPRALWTRPMSDVVPTPVQWPGPIVLPTSTPTPGQIEEAWPSEVSVAPMLLPYGSPWVPIPWGAVNAVNAVRGALGIREENFLDDVGMPRPVPKPEVNHRPPRPGQKEKKGRSNSGRLLLFYRAVKKAWHEIDEHLEKVDILYDALPGWVRNRERAKLPHEKIAALLRNWQHIDVSEAIYGLIENEVEDAVIGRGFKSLEDAFEKLGVRGWRGDLAMQYSTDALFDLYGAVKGGL